MISQAHGNAQALKIQEQTPRLNRPRPKRAKDERQPSHALGAFGCTSSSPAARRSALTSPRWFKKLPLRLSHIFGSCSAIDDHRARQRLTLARTHTHTHEEWKKYRENAKERKKEKGARTVQLPGALHRVVRERQHEARLEHERCKVQIPVSPVQGGGGGAAAAVDRTRSPIVPSCTLIGCSSASVAALNSS